MIFFTQTHYRWQMAKIRILSIYNDGSRPGTNIIGAKGQSLLVNVDGKRILFDTGMRGRYLMHNLAALKIDPQSIDTVVLSHGHRDHTGGLPELLSSREEPVELFHHPLCKRKRARGLGGIPYKALSPPRLLEEQREKLISRPVERFTILSEHAALMTAPPLLERDATEGLLVKEEGEWIRDRMEDELTLLLSAEEGLLLVTGCCHRGILNVLLSVRESFEAPIAALVGGLHMGSFSDDEIDYFVHRLRSDFDSPKLYLNHCTGEKAITRMRHNLGLHGVTDFLAGDSLEFNQAVRNIFI
ncbi:MAG: 7,8-dihydropterin-6-yl-methyl-4-(beta-D-ribofuranosyl)aminobenzene 5-phosphate synthase [Candidatus Methanomethylophilaceae archaeon]|nr:7,8-dihydropterin-6-yl-methyl-4-(beta-D-ribofuranosyl)aminobenzene 5-phosphate synthase [Candidatus Methanomethylophilaceae archaeon]